MANLDTIIKDLVIANRILAKEDVVDAYGPCQHPQPDNPKSFFISRSLAPELIEKGDIVELGLDGEPLKNESARSTSSASSTRRSTRRGPTSTRWCMRTPRTRCRSALRRRPSSSR